MFFYGNMNISFLRTTQYKIDLMIKDFKKAMGYD